MQETSDSEEMDVDQEGRATSHGAGVKGWVNAQAAEKTGLKEERALLGGPLATVEPAVVEDREVRAIQFEMPQVRISTIVSGSHC